MFRRRPLENERPGELPIADDGSGDEDSFVDLEGATLPIESLSAAEPKSINWDGPITVVLLLLGLLTRFYALCYPRQVKSASRSVCLHI